MKENTSFSSNHHLLLLQLLMPDHQQAQVPEVLAHPHVRLQILHSPALLARLQPQQFFDPQHLALHLHQPHFITLRPQPLQLHQWNQKLLLATIQQ